MSHLIGCFARLCSILVLDVISLETFQDSIEQVKGEIHKKELMKHTYPSGKRRASAAGGAKAGDVTRQSQ